jgi:hypothetical protein
MPLPHAGDGFCHYGFENRPIIEDRVGFSRWGVHHLPVLILGFFGVKKQVRPGNLL